MFLHFTRARPDLPPEARVHDARGIASIEAGDYLAGVAEAGAGMNAVRDAARASRRPPTPAAIMATTIPEGRGRDAR